MRPLAGASDREPIHSTSLQGRLISDEKVKLTGEESGGYYKVATPENMYLWISTEFTKPAEETVEEMIEETARAGGRPGYQSPTNYTGESPQFSRGKTTRRKYKTCSFDSKTQN